MTNPGTTPIIILAANSDHGLSFAGEETRTMVWVSFSLQIYSTFEFWSEFPHFMGMGLAAQCKIPPHIAQYPFEIVSQRGVSHPFALFS